jgi:hypothetical protein
MRTKRLVPAAALVAMLATQGYAAAPTDDAGQQVRLPPPEEDGVGGRGELALPRPRPTAVPRALDVREAGAPPDLGRPSANAGKLKDLVLVRLAAGEARVTLDGAGRTLHEGDSVAGDVVRRIDAERIILGRREGTRGEATVVVTFDAQRRARVLVFSTGDDTAPEAPKPR